MKNKAYTKFWKAIPEKKITGHDIVLRCAIRAFFAADSNTVSKEEIFKSLIGGAFTPITNRVKLDNGMHPLDGLLSTLPVIPATIEHFKKYGHGLFYSTYDETVTEIFSGSENDFKSFIAFVRDRVGDIRKSPRQYIRRNYSYIFVDQNDVEPIYQAVQAAHVAMVIGQKMNSTVDAANVYFQVCKVPPNFKYIGLFAAELEKNFGAEVERFYEPDVDRVIAIGTHPIPSHKRRKLRQFELLKFEAA